MRIYLAGSVPKGDKEQMVFNNWRIRYSKAIERYFDAEVIDPYSNHIDESDYLGVGGGDSMHIRDSDMVIVNAEEHLGVGTPQEMVIAKRFIKPVVTVLPKNTPHRRANVVFFGKNIEDWIHPFIHTFSDFIIEDIDELGSICSEIAALRPKGLEIIDKAIEHHEDKNNRSR